MKPSTYLAGATQLAILLHVLLCHRGIVQILSSYKANHMCAACYSYLESSLGISLHVYVVPCALPKALSGTNKYLAVGSRHPLSMKLQGD